MDTSEAGEILDGGKTNDLQTAGSLVKDPNVVIQLLFDGQEAVTPFGSFELAEDYLDYAVHRTRDVTLGEVDDYYALNLVEADVYTMGEDGSVSVQRFEATPNGWEKTDR